MHIEFSIFTNMIKNIISFNIFSFILFVFFFSCNSKKQKNTTDDLVKISKMQRKKKHKAKDLDSIASNNIKPWKEYFDLKDFLKIYESISSIEALNNSLELKQLTKLAKDSINIEVLKTPSFNARINVFQNEVSRLSDMSNIPSITAKEVVLQVENIFLTFNSLNSKIEHTFKKKMFNDSIKLDSVFDKLE